MNHLHFTSTLAIGLSVWLLGCTSPIATSQSPPFSTQDTAQAPAMPLEPAQSSPGQRLPITAQAIMGDEQIDLEVAQTPRQQAIGLMFRTSLADDRGMLFKFEPARPVQFWMRNTLIPLDMVFMRDGQIKAIAENVPPCTTPTCPTYGTDEAVNQVIELRGGRASELGLQVGDQVTIDYVDAVESSSTSTP